MTGPAAARPGRLVVVVGTGTGVGKTWVTARLARALRATGHTVAVRKPAQSFDPGDDPTTTDAAVLGAATDEAAETVCPPDRWYPVAMAPPMAARALGRPGFTISDLTAEVSTSWSVPSVDVGVVETAGGVRSPQADDGDAVDLLGLLSPDAVVLVADAGLGVINAVRLCTDALAGLAAAPPLIALNRFEPGDATHRDSRAWLERRHGVACLVVPGTEDALCRAVLG
jgi:dethiobiotin synthetase